MFSPVVVARSRLLAIASSRTMISMACATPAAPQICRRGFGIAAPVLPTMIARSVAHRNQLRRVSVVASAWRGDSGDSANDQPPVGRIEIITGPMFSGKSTELLRRAAEHEVKSFFARFASFFGGKERKPDLDHSLSLSSSKKKRPPGAASPWSRAPRTPDTASPRS